MNLRELKFPEFLFLKIKKQPKIKNTIVKILFQPILILNHYKNLIL